MRTTLTMIVAIAAMTLLGAPAAAADATMDIPDTKITDALEHELLLDPAVLSNRIDASTVDGVVTLTGSVHSVLAAERAVRIAETVRGVRAVVDRIAVEPAPARQDPEIRRDVQRALLDDPATDSYELDVSVDKGRVTLEGSVQSWTEKELAATVAKGVWGVVGLDNETTVDYRSDRNEAEIRFEIERALDVHVLVDAGLVDVAVEDGEVTLSGTVGSAAEKRLATRQAWTAGVKTVDNSGLEVRYWARDPDLRRDQYVSRSDDQIRDAIKDAMIHDPRVFSFNVDPEVEGGTVTLRGEVDNLKARRAAEQNARNTVGAVMVRNFLKVRPSARRSDTAIEADIRSALLRDPYVNRYGVTVEVFDGVAYLTGSVDTFFEKAQADDGASRINGVTDVVNGLRVENPRPYAPDPWTDRWSIYDYDWYHAEPRYSYTSDWEIERNIHDELFWSPFVDADEVKVEVEDAVATLTGTVDSWIERSAARDNAYEGGATYVRNRLAVE